MRFRIMTYIYHITRRANRVGEIFSCRTMSACAFCIRRRGIRGWRKPPAAAPSDRRAKTATAQRKSRPKRFRAIRARGKFDGDGRAWPFPLPTRQRTNAREENAIPRRHPRLWGRRPRATIRARAVCRKSAARIRRSDVPRVILGAPPCLPQDVGLGENFSAPRRSAPVPSQDAVRARETPFDPAVWESNFCLESNKFISL